MKSPRPVVPRALEETLRFALETFPAVVVTGARQTGKSTLVQELVTSGGYRYRTLDDLELLDQARNDPDGLVRSADRVILDEIQRSPPLLLAIKRAIDEDRAPGRFLLTGSANLLLMHRVSESLAGRASYLSLWPMTRGELQGKGTTGAWSELLEADDLSWKEILTRRDSAPGDWRALALRGGYPTPARELKDPRARSLWYEGYTRTYLERDLQELSVISSLIEFRRLMRAACLRFGSLLNQTELSRDVGIPATTVSRYLALLEASYQVVRLPAYAVNRTKRLLKTPKLFWSDTGLALHLAQESEPRGCHLEGLVLTDLLAWRETQLFRPELFHWRTTAGDEVDLVIESQDRLLPIEVKSSGSPRFSDAKSLRLFRSEYEGRARSGLLLHDGDTLDWIAEGVLAAPWWKVF